MNSVSEKECNSLSGLLALFSYFSLFFFCVFSILVLAPSCSHPSRLFKNLKGHRNFWFRIILFEGETHDRHVFSKSHQLADQEENQSSFCCSVLFGPFIQKEPTGQHSLGGKHTCNSCRRDGQLKEDIMSRDADPFSSTTCCPGKKKKFP